jgi:hypothetical protein
MDTRTNRTSSEDQGGLSPGLSSRSWLATYRSMHTIHAWLLEAFVGPFDCLDLFPIFSPLFLIVTISRSQFHTFKMTFSSLFLCTLVVAAPYAGAHTKVYTAKLMPFGDDSTVTGDVAVFTNHGTLAFAGNAVSFPYDNSTACEGENGK